MKPKNIRVISICIFENNQKILVFEAFDSVKETMFYRPLGGGVEPGETTQETLKREIREELSLEMTDPNLLGVVENIFIHEGNQGHEIVFVYDAQFVDKKVYDLPELTVHEDNGEVLRAVWRSLDSFNECHRLVPEKLGKLLEETRSDGKVSP